MRKMITLGLCAAAVLMLAGCCCPKQSCRSVEKCPKKECPAAAKKAEKNGELTEDELKKMLDDIQKLTDRYIGILEKMLADKDKDLMTV